MNQASKKRAQRQLRRNRVRSVVTGTASRPRLAVFRSSKYTYAQLIDDATGTTVAASSSAAIKSGTKTERSSAMGKLLAEQAKQAGIESIVFDRGGYKYHGRVKAVADAAREAGLKF